MGPMFDIEVSESMRVALVRFRGRLSEADFTTLEALAKARRDGPGYHVIFDLSRVEESQPSTDFVARRGELPQTFEGRERIYVVPQNDLKLLVRLYAAYQQSKGWKPPLVVDRLEEAFQQLGIAAADFRPVQTTLGGAGYGAQ
jgi:hypothetical protein